MKYKEPFLSTSAIQQTGNKPLFNISALMLLELEWTHDTLTLFKQYVLQARPDVAFQQQWTAVGAVQPH